MTFRANRPLNGDYGHVDAGQLFDIPDHICFKDSSRTSYSPEISNLVGQGVIERHVERPRVDRKMFTEYRNKAITPAENKSSESAPPVKPQLRAK